MLTNKPLRELMNEAAELHKNLTCNNRQQARLAITSVKFALLNRYEYKTKHSY